MGLAFLIIASQATAQAREIYREDRDNVPYYFGLSLVLGLMATARLNKRFEARFHPQLILGGSKYLTYHIKYPTPLEPETQKKTIPSTVVSFPLQMKFNSDRIQNFRVYMLGGLKYDIDVASNAGALNAESLVKLKKAYVGYEAGIGFNFYFPVVTVAPEIKITNGISNVHSRDSYLKYSNILDQLQSRMITFSLIFER